MKHYKLLFSRSQLQLLLIVFLLSVNSLAKSADPGLINKRIVGGEHVLDTLPANNESNLDVISQWPWVVALTNNGSQFCGASLIAKQWLLTAAHCVYDSATGKADTHLQIEAIFLKSELAKNNSQSFIRQVTAITIHPEYNYNLDVNDIALLKLDTSVDSITPVQLPGIAFDEFTVSAGTINTVLGWGLTQDNTDSDIILRKVELPITEQKTCSDVMANYLISIEDSMICAGYPQGGKDACSGDSGGPMAYFSQQLNSWVQTGIVSFGIGCAEADTYGVYTRIAKYTQPQQLINSTICDSTPETPNLKISEENQTITLDFSTQNQNNTFRLYYAPYPQLTPIHYIDIIGNSYSRVLPEGNAYYIAAQTREGNCISAFSTIKTVNL